MPRAWNRAHFLSALINSAYLPNEIPPVVTSKYFANFCQQNFHKFYSDRKKIIKQTTNYETFSVPRTTNGRRNLALVHPIGQLGLSLIITANRSRIIKLIGQSGTSLYRTHEDRDKIRAFSGLDFRKWEGLVRDVCSDHPFILKADISRFFYTAYTHTLPWSVLGKEKVKRWLSNERGRLRTHWSNDLDTALQSCQSRETFGIPVGPDTSRIISEILMSGIEADSSYKQTIDGKTAYRLIDDFVIGFENEEEANRTLSALRRSLWKYNLQLNDEKTGIFRSESIYRDRWKLEFDKSPSQRRSVKNQRRELDHLIDLTLHLCEEYQSATPAIFACNRIAKLQLYSSNTETAVRALLRFSRDFSSCTNHVCAFLINNQQIFKEPNIENIIKRWINETIQSSRDRAHDFELS